MLLVSLLSKTPYKQKASTSGRKAEDQTFFAIVVDFFLPCREFFKQLHIQG